METFSSRLRWALEQKGISQSELARQIGVNRAAINYWIKGKTKEVEGTNLAKAANILEVNALWLVSGKGPQKPGGLAQMYWDNRNVQTGPSVVAQIPLISWVQAGAFCESPDLFQPGDAETYLPTFKKMGVHSYALRVVGDSMTAQGGSPNSYPEGSIIFVDPDKSPVNGSPVVAKIHEDEAATFKIYSTDAGKHFLRPINPQYPTIEMTEGMHICGVVVGVWRDV